MKVWRVPVFISLSYYNQEWIITNETSRNICVTKRSRDGSTTRGIQIAYLRYEYSSFILEPSRFRKNLVKIWFKSVKNDECFYYSFVLNTFKLCVNQVFLRTRKLLAAVLTMQIYLMAYAQRHHNRTAVP